MAPKLTIRFERSNNEKHLSSAAGDSSLQKFFTPLADHVPRRCCFCCTVKLRTGFGVHKNLVRAEKVFYEALEADTQSLSDVKKLVYNPSFNLGAGVSTEKSDVAVAVKSRFTI